MSTPTHQEAIRLGLAVITDSGISLILNRHTPNLTVCPVCDVDDFVHAEGCKLAARVEEIWEWMESPQYEEQPVELGTLVYFA